jgi:hypothetical protein
MKKLTLLLTATAGLLLLALATPSFAADKADKGAGKEITITGDAKCAKCTLKETEKCQTAIQVEGKNGKPVTYYLADNDVAKNFHENVCTQSKKVTATGTLKRVDGKREFTASKIELVKEAK